MTEPKKARISKGKSEVSTVDTEIWQLGLRVFRVFCSELKTLYWDIFGGRLNNKEGFKMTNYIFTLNI